MGHTRPSWIRGLRSPGDDRWEVDLRDQPEFADPTEMPFVSKTPPVVHDGRIFVYLGEDRIAEFA